MTFDVYVMFISMINEQHPDDDDYENDVGCQVSGDARNFLKTPQNRMNNALLMTGV